MLWDIWFSVTIYIHIFCLLWGFGVGYGFRSQKLQKGSQLKVESKAMYIALCLEPTF